MCFKNRKVRNFPLTLFSTSITDCSNIRSIIHVFKFSHVFYCVRIAIPKFLLQLKILLIPQNTIVTTLTLESFNIAPVIYSSTFRHWLLESLNGEHCIPRPVGFCRRLFLYIRMSMIASLMLNSTGPELRLCKHASTL